MFSFRPAFLVLHGLRCHGLADDQRLALAVDMSREKTAEILHRLYRRGFVEYVPGPFGGWRLTPRGLATDDELTSSELEESGARDRVYQCYRSLLRLHPGLLEVADDWDSRPVGGARITNTHRDHGYDTDVLNRLARIDEAAQWVYAELGELLERFGSYGPRFSRALERALAGEHGYVTDRVDSYKAIWLQLHEDLRSTLDISGAEKRQYPG